MTIVNESGLYALLFYMQPQKADRGSADSEVINRRIEQLKAFKRWVTTDVTPFGEQDMATLTEQGLDDHISSPSFWGQLWGQSLEGFCFMSFKFKLLSMNYESPLRTISKSRTVQ